MNETVRSRRDALILGASLALLAACQARGGANATTTPDAPASAPADLHLPDPTAQARALGAATTALGVAMLAQAMATAPGTTLVTSPLSLAADLLMLGEGAKGAAADAIAQSLRLPAQGLSLPNAAQGFANIAARLVSSSVATVAIADALWADTRAGLLPQYRQALHDLFAAQASVGDLSSGAALAAINGFVSQTTHGKIPQILSQLPAAAMLVLVNALYFKGAWATPFDAALTQSAPFTHPDGSSAPAQLMHRHGSFAYRETDQLQALALPYADGRFELRLVLPKPGAAADAWTAGVSGYAPQATGDVFLPRLNLSWGGDLTGLLGQLGMGPALAPSADYSGAMTAPFGPLDVVQKCVLLVDEQGSEAAASTVITMPGAAAFEGAPPPPFVFRADRPFYAMLVETGAGAPLILAYVAAPGA